MSEMLTSENSFLLLDRPHHESNIIRAIKFNSIKQRNTSFEDKNFGEFLNIPINIITVHLNLSSRYLKHMK